MDRMDGGGMDTMDGMVWIEWMGRYGHYGKIVWIDEMNV
jgi:hypothetical protein